MNGSALFSACGTWRYALTRELADGAGTVAFVGLNPSTADDASDDPTIRRCIGFARDWGFARLEVVNVYALCASDPRDLWLADDPVGPENDRVLAQVLVAAELVIAAWGMHARADRLAELAAVVEGRRLHALGVTKNGAPRHPLYLRADVRPSPYAAPKKPLSAASFDAGACTDGRPAGTGPVSLSRVEQERGCSLAWDNDNLACPPVRLDDAERVRQEHRAEVAGGRAVGRQRAHRRREEAADAA